jgi:hypothetical protein
MYSPLGGRILHLMSPSYCCISVIQQSEMINPLEPRDAFYGGRTEAFTLFQKDQDISYVDVTR